MARKPCVLCVDDSLDQLQLRVALLSQVGYHAIACTDQQSALRLAKIIAVDLCILDYHLANGETGEHIARELRMRQPHLPLILLTGDSDVVDSAKNWFDAVFTKGQVEIVALLSAIKRLIRSACLRPPKRRAIHSISGVRS
jgi:CheY-like chemotaxis protein